MTPQTELRCAVVTPVGPGHQALYAKCQNSVTASFKQHRGIFSEVFLIEVDDAEGLYGRSRSRNLGVAKALAQQVEWVFFLDADDIMAPWAFEQASPYLLHHDAVWGLISCFDQAAPIPQERPGQLKVINDVLDLFSADPFLTLQMGHFVRTRVAYNNPFEPTLDAGEDFDYYLRVWRRYRCVKIPSPLFFNRRGSHSTGPRSANGLAWRMAVEERLVHYARQWGLPLSAGYGQPRAHAS